MPTPRSLVNAPQHDFELEVVAGAWPADISGEVVFSSPNNSRDDRDGDQLNGPFTRVHGDPR